jgi:uracil-DNA glycosylase family 4
MKSKQTFDALAFYCDNELDEFFLEEPHNHLAMYQHENNQPALTTKIINNPPANIDIALTNLSKKNLFSTASNQLSLEKIVQTAQDLADSCHSLAELKQAVLTFEGCNLKKMATNTVFADGNSCGKILVIGEAPGNEEDLQGIPFCGDSGLMLKDMFFAINLQRELDFYITNTVFWRPPGNRQPTPEEIAICKPFLHRIIQLVQPKIIILIGATATNNVLHCSLPIGKIHGKIQDFHPSYLSFNTKAVSLFHPAFLMRQPSKKKLVWQDLLNIKKYLQDHD